jgi:hypothetical protein
MKGAVQRKVIDRKNNTWEEANRQKKLVVTDQKEDGKHHV